MKFKYLLVFSVFSCLAGVTFAGNTAGTVSNIFIHGQNDLVLFRLTSTAPNFAECATTHRYVTSTATEQGKNILSTVLAAKAMAQPLTVYGMNECKTHGDAESIAYILVE